MEGLHREIARVAGDQHGVVSRAQLLERGVGRRTIDRLLRTGELRALHRGVYLAGAVEPPLARESAALLACGPHSVLSRGSAAALDQLLPYPAEGAPVEVTLPVRHRRHHEGITVYRQDLHRRDWWIRKGLRATTPLRTILDLAAADPAGAELALNEALARRLVSPPSLAATIERHPRRPGTRFLRALLSEGHGPKLLRSHPERELLRLIRLARLPEPQTNVRVGRWEVDMYWPERRLVVEVDGYSAHSSPGAFEHDRLREAELRSLGLRLRRFTARQVSFEPEATLASLAGELVVSGG